VPGRPPRDQHAAPLPRRTGRPRVDQRPVLGDPTEAILVTAGRLFGELGVAGTTMSRLAEEVGLKQSSLYYYFRSREAVTAALVARANVVPLELLDRIRDEGGSAPAQLHRFVRGDVEALCLLPFDIGEIHRIAARERDRFGDYWAERARLERRLAAIVRRGIADGDLRAVDAMFTALTIMSNDEGVQNWYRLGSRRKPSEIGEAMADLVVGGLLSPSRQLADVVAESRRLERA
jgi:AcrR family transcriptional regulator